MIGIILPSTTLMPMSPYGPNFPLALHDDAFVERYLAHQDTIIGLRAESSLAADVFVWLLQHVDQRNVLLVSTAALAEALGQPLRQIGLATRLLSDHNLVRLFHTGSSVIYALDAPTLMASTQWQTGHKGLLWAMVATRVYISASEQDPDDSDPYGGSTGRLIGFQPSVWQTDARGHRYQLLNTTVYLSKREQPARYSIMWVLWRLRSFFAGKLPVLFRSN